MTVAGQVTAQATRLHETLPSNKELGSEKLRWKHPLLTHLQPVTELGEVIQASIKHGKGGFAVTDTMGELLAGGVHFEERKPMIGNYKLIFKDAEGSPLVLAIENKVTMNKHFTIYGTEQLASCEDVRVEDGVKFYPWFRIREMDEGTVDYRSILVWTGTGFKTILQVIPMKRNLLQSRKGTCVVRDADKKQYAVLNKTKDEGQSNWELVVAPGVDPSLMIVLAACMERLGGGWFA